MYDYINNCGWVSLFPAQYTCITCFSYLCLLIILLLIKVEEAVDPKGKNDTGSVKADSPVLAMLKEQQADVFKYLMY